MLSGRGDGRIGQTRDNDIDVRLSGKPAVLRVVVRAFHVLHCRRDRDRTTQMCTRTGKTQEVRQTFQGKIDFTGRTSKFVSTDILNKIARKVLGTHKFIEGQPWIDTRRNDPAANLVAISENHSLRLPILDEN